MVQWLCVLFAFVATGLTPPGQEATKGSSVVTAAQDQDPKPTRIREVLGLEFAVTSSLLRRSIVRTATPYGFAVRSVAKDSLAAGAGITRGTVVLAVDGVPLRKVQELEDVLRDGKPGQKVVLLCAQRRAVKSLLDRHPWVNKELTVVLPAAAPVDGRK